MAINQAEATVIGKVRPEDFKAFVGSFPTGVTVVTWRDAGFGAGGMTVNAFASISMEPPLVMVSLGRGSRALEPVLHTGSFGVNILGGDGARAATAFSRRATADLDDFAWSPGVLGSPLLTGDAEAMADCEVEDAYEAGDHTIVIGRVHEARNCGNAPLGYLRRTFSRWG